MTFSELLAGRRYTYDPVQAASLLRNVQRMKLDPVIQEFLRALAALRDARAKQERK